MLNIYSKRAYNIIVKHYNSNGINPLDIEDDEISMFWWEADKEDINEWVYSLGFKGWADMKRSPHVCGVYNTGDNKVLVFADFESLI